MALESDRLLECGTSNRRHSNIPWQKTDDSKSNLKRGWKSKTFSHDLTWICVCALKGVFFSRVNVPQFEMCKIDGIDTDALCPELILFSQSVCIQRHRLREQHPFLSILPHNSIPYFWVQPAKPVWKMCTKRRICQSFFLLLFETLSHERNVEKNKERKTPKRWPLFCLALSLCVYLMVFCYEGICLLLHKNHKCF